MCQPLALQQTATLLGAQGQTDVVMAHEDLRLAVWSHCSFEDGLKLVKLRGESMQAASDASPSGMISVIGLDAEKVGCQLCSSLWAWCRDAGCC